MGLNEWVDTPGIMPTKYFHSKSKLNVGVLGKMVDYKSKHATHLMTMALLPSLAWTHATNVCLQFVGRRYFDSHGMDNVVQAVGEYRQREGEFTYIPSKKTLLGVQ